MAWFPGGQEIGQVALIAALAFTPSCVFDNSQKGKDITPAGAASPALQSQYNTSAQEDNMNDKEDTATSNRISIVVGSQSFSAELQENDSTRAFKKQLPLTVNMADLNSNEKFCDLLNGLPTNASNPGTIRSGDLMLYGSKTLALFYGTFSTSYSYTKLGAISDPSGLERALGAGGVLRTFQLD